MDLNEILVFTKLMESKSFTLAAEALGVPKSTVSRKLANLEERLGVRLLQRTTRKLAPTDIGQAFFERCQRIVADLAEAEAVVSDMHALPRGLLRVSVPVDIAVECLRDVFAAFVRAHPDVNLDIDANDDVVDLIEEGIDVAIRMGPLPESSLTARKLATFSMHLCASPEYLAAHGMPTTFAELDDHAHILFAPTKRVQSWMLRCAATGETYEFGRPARLAANNFAIVRDALVAGLGIGLCAELVVAADLRAGRLVRIGEHWTGGHRDMYAVYPSRQNMSRKAASFVAHLTQGLQM